MRSIGCRHHDKIDIRISNDILVGRDDFDIVTDDRSTGLFAGTFKDGMDSEMLGKSLEQGVMESSERQASTENSCSDSAV
jgi:hypothetical protein